MCACVRVRIMRVRIMRVCVCPLCNNVLSVLFCLSLSSTRWGRQIVFRRYEVRMAVVFSLLCRVLHLNDCISRVNTVHVCIAPCWRIPFSSTTRWLTASGHTDTMDIICYKDSVNVLSRRPICQLVDYT